jgi:hypothetical protein
MVGCGLWGRVWGVRACGRSGGLFFYFLHSEDLPVAINCGLVAKWGPIFSQRRPRKQCLTNLLTEPNGRCISSKIEIQWL